MRHLYCVLFVVSLAAVALAVSAQAAAPRGSVQRAGHILQKLDPTQPPNYPNEFFTLAPAPGEKGGREQLIDDIADAVRVMAETTSTAADYCPRINDILLLAVGTNTYFDIAQPSNPALEDFKKDWLKVQKQAMC